MKVTKIEKVILGSIIVLSLFISLFISGSILYLGIVINDAGLKTVVERVWEGSNE